MHVRAIGERKFAGGTHSASIHLPRTKAVALHHLKCLAEMMGTLTAHLRDTQRHGVIHVSLMTPVSNDSYSY